MIYPWQHSQWESLLSRVHQRKLPHALFLSGAVGLGKLDFAREFANYLLCESPENNRACQRCAACLLFAASSHPDMKVIARLENKKQISVDQIRELGTFLSLTAQKAKQKVVIVENADRMNTNAANSLLKNLEEPSGSAVLMLVSDRIHTLPATIKSRCQNIQFNQPDFQIATQWLSSQGSWEVDVNVLLSLARGAPLAALKLANNGQVAVRSDCFRDVTDLISRKADPIKQSATWSKCDQQQLFIWIQSWLSDMIKLKMTKDHKFISNIDFIEALKTISDKIGIRALYKSYDLASESLRMTETQVNSTLLLEKLLIELSSLGLDRENQRRFA